MAERVIFLSGLPRSGSTLLSRILSQNPRFEVTPTSPLPEYIEAMSQAYSNSPQRRAYLDQQRAKSRFLSACRGAIDGYFRAPVGVDKSRGWTGKCELLNQLYGDDLRIIVTVRDLRGCVLSQEKRYRKHPEFAWDGPMLDIQGRVSHWMNSAPLGPAATQIQEAIRTGHARRFLVVRMEDLCSNPADVMRGVYDYIDEQHFDHDFDRIPVHPAEHDGIHAPIGHHSLTSPEIQPVDESWNQALGPGLSQQIMDGNQWFYSRLYPERLVQWNG